MATICRSSYLYLFQVTFFHHLKLYRCNQGPGKTKQGDFPFYSQLKKHFGRLNYTHMLFQCLVMDLHKFSNSCLLLTLTLQYQQVKDDFGGYFF